MRFGENVTNIWNIGHLRHSYATKIHRFTFFELAVI